MGNSCYKSNIDYLIPLLNKKEVVELSENDKIFHNKYPNIYLLFFLKEIKYIVNPWEYKVKYGNVSSKYCVRIFYNENTNKNKMEYVKTLLKSQKIKIFL